MDKEEGREDIREINRNVIIVGRIAGWGDTAESRAVLLYTQFTSEKDHCGFNIGNRKKQWSTKVKSKEK